MTNIKETKYLLRNLHSYIKNDNIEQFINLVSLYPNIINYKNSKKENLIFYCLLKNSYKISSYILAINNELLLERNSNGENAIQASLSREESVDFFLDIAPSLSKEILNSIYSNLDNQGNTLLMKAANTSTPDKLVQLLELCPNKDFFHQINKHGSNLTHFLTSNSLYQDFSKTFSYIDDKLFLSKNKTHSTPLMLAANFYSKEDFEVLTDYAFKGLSQEEIQDFCEQTNIFKFSIIEYALFNNDYRIYADIEKDYLNSSFTFETIQAVLDKMKNQKGMQHIANLIHYFKNHEPLNDDVAQEYYSLFFYHCLATKNTELFHTVFTTEPDIAKYFSLTSMFKLNRKYIKIENNDFKYLENIPGIHLHSIIDNQAKTSPLTKDKLYALIYNHFLSKHNDTAGFLSLVENFNSICKKTVKINKREFASFLIQRLFYLKNEDIKNILAEDKVLKFCDDYQINNLLGLVSYTRNLPYKEFLNNDEPIIPNYLNEHLLNNSSLFHPDSTEYLELSSLLNNKKVSPTYGYWSLFDKEIYPYFKNIENTSLIIEGMSLSCNKKNVDLLLKNNEIVPFLCTLQTSNFNNHLGNFISSPEQLEQFIDDLQKYKDKIIIDNPYFYKDKVESLIFLNGLKIIALSQINVDEKYINGLTQFISMFDILKENLLTDPLFFRILNTLKDKLKIFEFEPNPPRNLIELNKNMVHHYIYGIIPITDNNDINKSIKDDSYSHFILNEETQNGHNKSFSDIFLESIKFPGSSYTTLEMRRLLQIQFKPTILDIYRTSNNEFETQDLIEILDKKQSTETFLLNFNNNPLKLFKYIFINNVEYKDDLELVPSSFLSQENFDFLLEHYSNNFDKTIAINLYLIGKINNLDINKDFFLHKNFNYNNVDELILMTAINPFLLQDKKIIEYWSNNFEKIVKEPGFLINKNIYYFAANFPDIVLNNKDFKIHLKNLLNVDNSGKKQFPNQEDLRYFFEQFLINNYKNNKIKDIYDEINEDVFENYELITHIENLIMKDNLHTTESSQISKQKVIKF